MVSPKFITSLTYFNKNLVKIPMKSAKNKTIKYSLGPVRTTHTFIVHYLCVCLYEIRNTNTHNLIIITKFFDKIHY